MVSFEESIEKYRKIWITVGYGACLRHFVITFDVLVRMLQKVADLVSKVSCPAGTLHSGLGSVSIDQKL